MTRRHLVDFPSVVWAEVDYSVYVLRQASRRSWRIGQHRPVEVTFLAYEGTLQAEALALVAAKMRASLMIEGELPEEGLAALDGDGGDVYLELARRLAEPDTGRDGQGHSLEALFADTRQVERERDELLVECYWNDESDLTWERIPVPVQTIPGGIGGLDDLPLFAGIVDEDAPVPNPLTNGKVVTFEELARLVRRRNPRRKPVSKEQLALFDS